MVFTIWSCCYLTNKENADPNVGSLLEIVNFAFAIYFIIIELIQLVNLLKGKADVKDRQIFFEVILSLACPILNSICLLTDFTNDTKLD